MRSSYQAVGFLVALPFRIAEAFLAEAERNAMLTAAATIPMWFGIGVMCRPFLLTASTNRE